MKTKLLIGFLAVLLLNGAAAWSQAPTPELMHYRFNGTGSIIPNEATSPPANIDTATIVGGLTMGPTGQCGNALIGNGQSSTSNYVNTNWATNLTGTSWTISFWTNNIPSTTSTYYIMGDVNAGQLRIFTGGVAGAGNWILRGAFTDVLANGGAAAGPTMTTFVYDMPNNEIRSYVNGVLNQTIAQAGVNITGTGPFKVGGYSSSANLPAGSLMDEFRLYNHALTQAEINSLMIAGSTSTFNVTACASYTVPSGEETYTASGTYMDTIPNINGCDSIMTINVNIIPPTSSTIAPVVCDEYDSPSGNYQWTASGTYMDTIPNAAGCDSVITINLTVNQPTFSTIDPISCGDYTAPDGSVYSTSGTYSATLPNMNNCDSVITINLTVNQPSSSTMTIVTCDSYMAPDGQMITGTGTYVATIPNAANCDSVITINLTTLESSSSTLTETACNSYLAPDGAEYTTSGVYEAVIPNAIGCDSIITINLTIVPIDTAVTYMNGVLTVGQSTGVLYQWVDCTTGPINAAYGQSFTPTANGSYAVFMSGANCTVNSNCHTITNVGLEEFSALDLSLFPNPVNEVLTISNAKGNALTLQLYDNAGKLLQTIATSETEVKIGMQDKAPGVYMLKVAGSNAEKTFKIVRN